MSEELKEKIIKALEGVKYPGFDQDIITMGLAQEFAVEGKDIHLRMKELHADDGVKAQLVKNIEDALSIIGMNVKVTFGGGEDAQQQAPQQGPPPKQEIPGVKRVLPVASGKGGVGKSTVAVNLAVALAKEGRKVALLDLDVYGPSVPTMLGINEPKMKSTEQGKLIPFEKYGVKTVSIGFLMEPDAALIWRGPMVMKVVKQFFYDVDWGEIDDLVLDLPPGTGDVQLTLLQSIPVHGAVVVTTPQDVALKDVAKAIDMFDKTEAKVLGIIENMSMFICPHCGKESHIFGHEGGKRESEKRGIPLLGQIPLEPSITEDGDKGEPAAATGDGQAAGIFRGIAKKLIEDS